MSAVAWAFVGLGVFAVCLVGFIVKRMQLAKRQEARADWSRVQTWDADDDDDDWGQPPAPPGTPPR